MKYNHPPVPETPLGQKLLTLLFLLPAAGLNIVYVIFFNCFLKLLKFCSLIVLFKVLINIVRHLQVLCFSADNVAYGPVGAAGRNQMFQQFRPQKTKSYFSILSFPEENIYSNVYTVHFCRIMAPATIQSGNYNLRDSKLCSTNRIHPPATVIGKYPRVFINLGHEAVGSGFSLFWIL